MAGRILIADDVATNRIVLKVKLSRASYDVTLASNRSELIAQAQTGEVDLILLDGAFENDRSIDICHELSQDPVTAAIPILIQADDYSGADRIASLRSGAADVLKKPLSDAVLLAHIRNALRIKAVDSELTMREGTAQELGFAETAQQFENQAQVLLINDAPKRSIRWQEEIQSNIPCDILRINATQALEHLARDNPGPDVVVLRTSQQHAAEGLFLLAELRSRNSSRHAAIVVVHDGDLETTAVSALDLGANEVVSGDTPPAEIALRLRRLLDRKKKTDRLRATFEDGLRMAVTDPLTGLFNRRYALPHLARIAEKSKLTTSPFAVMVLDLDRFKRINDVHGHQAGDAVLCEVAKRLKANVRSVDLIARIGGEEFLVVMPDTDLESARVAAERLRHVTEASAFKLAGENNEIRVTTSIGVSVGGLETGYHSPADMMIDQADQALLGAKSQGRNTVTLDRSAA